MSQTSTGQTVAGIAGSWFAMGSNRNDLSPSIRAIVISVHPERRDDWGEIGEPDDEAFERLKRRREREGHRRLAIESEDALLQATQVSREKTPLAPSKAYSPEQVRS
jgi:hypothetical protein